MGAAAGICKWVQQKAGHMSSSRGGAQGQEQGQQGQQHMGSRGMSRLCMGSTHQLVHFDMQLVAVLIMLESKCGLARCCIGREDGVVVGRCIGALINDGHLQQL